MDASRLLEIRIREAANIVNRSQQSDSSLRTFTIVSRVAGCGIVDSRAPTTAAVMLKNIGCEGSYEPTGDFITSKEVCCGQTVLPQAEPHPTLSCVCAEERRYVAPKCGCK